MASSAEIQTVLQEALRAQELEDDGDLGLAAEAYLRAACQLSYFVDLHVEKGTAAADFCQGLVQQYEQRITVSCCGKMKGCCACCCLFTHHTRVLCLLA